MTSPPAPAVGRSLDHRVRQQLSKWPQCPPGIEPNGPRGGTWLKGRPGDQRLSSHPFLKLPGSQVFRTLPDGMWLHFSPGSARDPYVDILCIEACSTLANLLDKRSRFAPSVSSLLALCPLPWLLAPPERGGAVPRWRLIRWLEQQPTGPLMVPVRDVRVVFGLQRPHYGAFAENQVPQPHEYFCPMEALTAEGGDKDPAMRALMARTSSIANFMHFP